MPASLFEGIPAEELQVLLRTLEHRRYPAGSTLIAEGETSHELCVMQSGSADVLVTDRQGDEHVVGNAGPGTSIGEMSLLNWSALPSRGSPRGPGRSPTVRLAAAICSRGRSAATSAQSSPSRVSTGQPARHSGPPLRSPVSVAKRQRWFRQTSVSPSSSPSPSSAP